MPRRPLLVAHQGKLIPTMPDALSRTPRLSAVDSAASSAALLGRRMSARQTQFVELVEIAAEVVEQFGTLA